MHSIAADTGSNIATAGSIITDIHMEYIPAKPPKYAIIGKSRPQFITHIASNRRTFFECMHLNLL